MGDYDAQHLQFLAAEITLGHFTMDAAATKVRDSRGNPRPVAHSTLREAFKRFGIEFPVFCRGRPHLELPGEVLELVQERFSFYPRGASKMLFALQAPEVHAQLGYKVTATMVQYAYELLQLWRYHLSDVPEEIARCHYCACQVNLIWHTDLHQPKDHSGGYYIAFIDDASRKCLYAEFFERKWASNTANAMATAVERVGSVPFALWSDNGTEFKAEFDDFLKSHDIRHVLNDPYTPQQNGKIERWWSSLEQRPKDVPLEEWIRRYNTIEHVSLPRNPECKDHAVPMNPNQAYESLPHWPQPRARWVVDDVERDFDPGNAPRQAEEARRRRQKKVPQRHRIPVELPIERVVPRPL